MSYFRGSTNSSGPWLIDCPALKDEGNPVPPQEQEHKRDCGALAGEGCNHRSYRGDVEHVIHDARSIAWAKLADGERQKLWRAWRVAKKLREAR